MTQAETLITPIGKIMKIELLLAVLAGVAILLILILRLKLPAFISLLIASISVGLFAGMSPEILLQTMKEGMASTLGFVAVVVGLGAMFGALLEQAGGAEVLAQYILGLFGEKRASWALMITGFFVAIPVFFDVAFIILVPLVYSLQRKTGKSILKYAIPLLAGLAITHTFIPPTPGPVAVADILNADLGWVIIMGFLVSIPTAIVCGPILGNYLAKKIYVKAPLTTIQPPLQSDLPGVGMVFTIISVPIVLIVLNTLLNSPLFESVSIPNQILFTASLLGHPFSALIIANLSAWYFLGIKRNKSPKELLELTRLSFGPAGVIILLTGAGGVFKQVLINTGAGLMLAEYFATMGMPIMLLSFILAALVRIMQGSATVAMITAAGICAPLLEFGVYGPIDLALLVMSIASGASILSHVNDSGFWLVSNYLGMNEKQTFSSWTLMTTILALTGFSTACLISVLF